MGTLCDDKLTAQNLYALAPSYSGHLLRLLVSLAVYNLRLMKLKMLRSSYVIFDNAKDTDLHISAVLSRDLRKLNNTSEF